MSLNRPKRWPLIACLAVLGACASDGATGPESSAPSTATLTVANQTRHSIFYLYYSACGSGSWGPDRLGSSTIASGSSRSWSGIRAGCYDLLAVLSTGEEVQRFDTDLRRGYELRWTLSN